MGDSLTFAEVAFVIFYGIKITLTFRTVLSDIFWEIYEFFILQELLPLAFLYLIIR